MTHSQFDQHPPQLLPSQKETSLLQGRYTSYQKASTNSRRTAANQHGNSRRTRMDSRNNSEPTLATFKNQSSIDYHDSSKSMGVPQRPRANSRTVSHAASKEQSSTMTRRSPKTNPSTNRVGRSVTPPAPISRQNVTAPTSKSVSPKGGDRATRSIPGRVKSVIPKAGGRATRVIRRANTAAEAVANARSQLKSALQEGRSQSSKDLTTQKRKQPPRSQSHSASTTPKKAWSKSQYEDQFAVITKNAGNMNIAIQDIGKTEDNKKESPPSTSSTKEHLRESDSKEMPPQEKSMDAVSKDRNPSVVTFAGGESHGRIYEDTQEPSTKWYSEEDLSRLLTHEMNIFMRVAQTNQNRSLRCCGRGFEHIQLQYDKAQKIKQHVQQVLAAKLKLEGDAPETMTMKLRIVSQMNSKLDRKLARQLALEDERVNYGHVQTEKMITMQREIDMAAMTLNSSNHVPTKDAFTAACKLANHAVKGRMAERPVQGAVALFEQSYDSTRTTMANACDMTFLVQSNPPKARSSRDGFFSRVSKWTSE